MPELILKIGEVEQMINYDEANLVEVDRCDFHQVKVGSVKKTDEGYLKGSAPIAKVGVMKYLKVDGTTISEYVPAETLFNKDSMDTLKLQPVTDTHPREILLDSRNVKQRKVGMTGETVAQDGNFLIVTLAITDSDAVRNAEEGRSQLSPGYRCYLIKQDGEFNGVKYDAIQINRRYNHVALCDKARGGSDLKLNLDGFDGIETVLRKGEPMPKFKIDGIDYDASQEVINHIAKLQANVDAVTAKVSALTTERDTLQANVDSQKTKIDSLEKRDVQKEVNEGITKRIGLLKVAEVLLDAEQVKKIDSMSNLDLKKAVIAAKSPNTKLDDKSEVYIDARYEFIVEGLDFDPDAIAKQRADSASRFTKSSDVDPVEKAKTDSEKRITEGWANFGK